MSIKKHIPNIITLLNLFSGCIAIYFVINDSFKVAAFFVVLGIFFDFFDGFFARLLDVKSELGLQLDSLADMVTSGLVPGLFMFQLLKKSDFISAFSPGTLPSNYWVDWLPFLGFIITLASAYRLANFNIDTRQTDAFIGLPTPANTLLIMSLGLIYYTQPQSFVGNLLGNTYFLFGVIIVSSYLLNAEIYLFSLKFKNWSFSENKLRFLFILFSIPLLALLGYLGVVLVILLYVLLSVVFRNGIKKEA